jgi:hypothetical protein
MAPVTPRATKLDNPMTHPIKRRRRTFLLVLSELMVCFLLLVWHSGSPPG